MAEKFGVGTLDLPMLVVRKDGPHVPEGSYLPEQLGLYMEGVYAINVGLCTSYPEVSKFQKWLGWKDWEGFHSIYAHAHVESGVICFGEGAFVFSNYGQPSDVLVHEYCHILRGPTSGEEDSHDAEWKSLMRHYGLYGMKYILYSLSNG